MLHSDIELSKIPARFSSGKTLSHNAYICLQPSSAFITPKEKGQEEISRPDRRVEIENRPRRLRNPRKRSPNQKMTDGFQAQWDSYSKLQSPPAFILATPGGQEGTL
jgi:hypothetical protein